MIRLPAILATMSTSSLIVTSLSVPKLIGSRWSEAMIRTSPSTKSSTYIKERVCSPWIQRFSGGMVRTKTSQRVSAVVGVGALKAGAMVASVGDARNFSSGRQLAAWLGLVPRQHSTGGKSKLLGISKRGDCYLRTLLIHGAHSVIATAGRRKQSMRTSRRYIREPTDGSKL